MELSVAVNDVLCRTSLPFTTTGCPQTLRGRLPRLGQNLRSVTVRIGNLATTARISGEGVDSQTHAWGAVRSSKRLRG